MFPTSIAGSLPKPAWLAETRKLWPQWKTQGEELRQAKQRVRPEVQWTLDAITSAAAFVSNERLDILAANQLGQALFSELYATPARSVNTARFVFLDPRAEAFFGDWDRVANEAAAILRSAAGRDRRTRRTL